MVKGLKNVLVKITCCPGCPMYGTAFGLLDGALDGDTVANTKFLALGESIYQYLTEFTLPAAGLLMTVSTKKDDVTIL